MEEYINAIGYARVSTTEQVDEGHSLDAQRQRLEKFCQTKGWSMIEFLVDEGKSGSTMEARPEFMRFKNNLERYAGYVLVVTKIDRLGRSQAEVHSFVVELEKHNIKLAVQEMDLDLTTVPGRMVFGTMVTLAEAERQMIGERTSAVLQSLKKDFKFVGAPPRGYRISPKSKKLVVVKEEAGIVKEMFEYFAQPNTTKKGTARTFSIQIASLDLILRNKIYNGQWMFGRTWVKKKLKEEGEWIPGEHEPIISDELFEKVQCKLSDIHKKYEQSLARAKQKELDMWDSILSPEPK